MLKVVADAADPLEVEADVLVVPVFKGGIEGPGLQPVLAALSLAAPPVTPDFRGDIGQHLLLAAPGLRVGAVCLVGLGRMDATDDERLRRAAGVAAAAVRRCETLATTLAQVHASAGAIQAVAEGLILGAYTDRRFKTASEPEASALRQATILVPSSRLDQGREAVQRAERYAAATCHARDLVNLPPDRKRPAELAELVAGLAGGTCEVTVLDESELAEEGFGGLLAVGRGSSAPPRLVTLRYRPDQPLGHVVLAGKGITFDTGGLSLKRGSHMDEMKSDMAGAAAVGAACAALADLDVRVEVTGLLGLAENMPGGDAQRPQDVVTIHGGGTVEVLDTDAEGRLVLADLLDYGASLEPDALVDLATLTGSAIGALGVYAAAIMSNDADLEASLRQAAGMAGEALWPLPLWDDLERFLDSPVADVNNTADGPGGGAVTAALFLQRFTAGRPWAHLDIAGPAFMTKELARDYLATGGTGFGVRTLLTWLERRGS